MHQTTTPAGQALLSRLVGPDAEHFFDEFYEKKPVIFSAGEPGRFDDLITIDRLDARVAETDFQEGMLHMVNARDPIDVSTFISPSGAIDRVAVARNYRTGATVVFNQLHNNDKRLADFCRKLERLFGCHVQTNLYLTPPNEQGFRTHYDNHDVFIVQITGEKRWTIYSAPVDTPYRGENFSLEEVPGEEKTVFTLKSGDVAYIPRGYFHDAVNETADQASLHITVGLIVRTWADLMLEAVSEVCLANTEFRRALPRGYAEPGFDVATIRPEFKRMAQLLADSVVPDAAIEQIIEAFVRSREPDVTGAIARNRADDGIAYRASSLLYHVHRDEDGVRVIGPGSHFKFGRATPELVERVLSGEPFRLTELDDPEARDVVERLMTAGLIRPD